MITWADGSCTAGEPAKGTPQSQSLHRALVYVFKMSDSRVCGQNIIPPSFFSK